MGAAIDTGVIDREDFLVLRDLDFAGSTIPVVHPKQYVADPVLAEFQRDNSFVRMVMGPIGSGKSACCAVEVLKRASQQRPNREGVRRSKWAIIRQTYPMLKSTTIPTWEQWSRGARIIYDTPIRSSVQTLLPDGTTMDLTVYFLAMQHSADVERVMSLELTGAWLNEVREIPKTIIDGVLGRVGRFPSKDEGGFNWSGVIADTNPPPAEHWFHRLAEEEKPVGWRFFRQPGALLKVVHGRQVSYIDNPAAENVTHQELAYEYWRRQLAGKDPDWIQVYVLGEYGSVFTGMPVYGDWWSQSFHVAAKPLEPYRGLPLYFGWDFGLTPAVFVFQLTARGQLRALREFCCPDGGLQQFCQNVVLPAITRDFPGMQRRSWADPAGSQRSQADEVTCIATLNRLGFNCQPAPTNDFTVRRDAVIGALGRVIDGEPGLLVDPSMTTFIRGMAGGYQFARVRIEEGEEMFRYVPNKNRFSHICEAGQYGMLGALSPQGVVATEPARTVVQPPERWGF